MLGVQFYMLIPDPLEDLADFGLRGQAASAAKESPCLHQRADGDVKGAACFLAAPQRNFEKMKKPGLDHHRVTRGFTVDGREFALLLVTGHLLVDAVHFLEGLLTTSERNARSRP